LAIVDGHRRMDMEGKIKNTYHVLKIINAQKKTVKK
jgi:hypothetical protein